MNFNENPTDITVNTPSLQGIFAAIVIWWNIKYSFSYNLLLNCWYPISFYKTKCQSDNCGFQPTPHENSGLHFCIWCFFSDYKYLHRKDHGYLEETHL